MPKIAYVMAALAVLAAASQPSALTQTTDARALWNQAIAAKGGRERLDAVRNMVVTSRTRYARSPRPDVATGLILQRFYAFPSRILDFSDFRPGKLGVSLSLFNLEGPRGWNAAGAVPNRAGFFDDARYNLAHGQFLYLMETAFLKPDPVGVRRGRLDRVDVDIVEATVSEDVRVEYFLDAATHLPLRLAVHRTTRIPPDVPLRPQTFKIESHYTLGAYREVDGIQMPTVVRSGDEARDTNSTSYRFNVEYNGLIFEDPPPGLFRNPELDAWRTTSTR